MVVLSGAGPAIKRSESDCTTHVLKCPCMGTFYKKIGEKLKIKIDVVEHRSIKLAAWADCTSSKCCNVRRSPNSPQCNVRAAWRCPDASYAGQAKWCHNRDDTGPPWWRNKSGGVC